MASSVSSACATIRGLPHLAQRKRPAAGVKQSRQKAVAVGEEWVMAVRSGMGAQAILESYRCRAQPAIIRLRLRRGEGG
jgi:hypothetical protein